MPLISGLASKMTVGAKTWRPKPDEQIALEAQQRRLQEDEAIQLKGIEKKMETLENVRKLEEKTQRFNELAAQHELRAQAAEAHLRERAAINAKRREIARLELAKREGVQALSEAETQRIRRERMKAELLARAAETHATNQRPILNSLDLAGIAPGPGRPVNAPSRPTLPIPPTSLPPPPLPPVPVGVSLNHRRIPSDPGARMRRLSGGGLPPPVGLGRGSNWGLPSGALRGRPSLGPMPIVRGRGGFLNRGMPSRAPPQPGHRGPLRRPVIGRTGRVYEQDVFGQRALRLQAERLRQRKLQTLDLRARQQVLRAQALRELRQRELAAQLRERGLQQREIEAEVRLMGEKERLLNEAQLKELRDRDHRLRLKEKGLQEREILDQIRRRDELDREALRIETERLERDLKNEEIADAERAIRRAMERHEAPPMGVARPSVEELEAEGYLNDNDAFYEDFHRLDPRLQQEIISEGAITTDMLRTP